MIERIKESKERVIFGISCLLFLLAILFLAWTYVVMERQMNEEPEDPIEVSLPVINWEKYSNLSKKHPNDIIDYR